MDRLAARPPRGTGFLRSRLASRKARVAAAAAAALVVASAPASAEPPSSPRLAALSSAAPRIDRDVLALALRAVQCAERRDALERSDVLTVIDYSRPSTEPRLWVFDLERSRLLHEELVAHGQGSGVKYATRFSNRPGSHQSSLGLFATLDTYVGRHGRSLRLAGLEPGVNHLAYERAIVVHGAAYVETAFVSAHGRLGRSHGCPALRNAAAPEIIDRIRGGTPVFAYYPDREWLESSKFLGSCEDAPVHQAKAAALKRRS